MNIVSAMDQATFSDKILIVEDDRKIASLVGIYLEREGFKTLTANDGHQALELIQRNLPDFVILDLMLPKMDGWEVCRELRRLSDIPILILTSKTEEIDRILGLSMGADDYVVKPFSPRELVERVKAILRRTKQSSSKMKGTLSHGELVLDIDKRKVSIGGRPISLTPSEFKLLLTLLAAPGRVFTREELLNRLYPAGEAVIDRVIDVHIGKIRQKIEANPSHPQYILTIRGVGYHFAERSG